jgi:hypothetical protein
VQMTLDFNSASNWMKKRRSRLSYGLVVGAEVNIIFLVMWSLCTNIYNMPFGMFVGVNNHFQSVLNASVLMRNETAESFKWGFQEFLNLMGGKALVTILTGNSC